MSDKRHLVIYHASCADGFTAAYCAWRKLGDSADYVAAHYGNEPPDVTGKNVYVLDFSYPAAVLEEMIGRCDTLVLLDHHKTAQADLEAVAAKYADEPKVLIRFDMTKSGAMLAWEHFEPTLDPPLLIHLVQDRDLWQWKLPYSREISAAMASYAFGFDPWHAWAEAGVEDLSGEGRTILRYQAQVVRSHVEKAREVLVAGHKVLMANCTTLVSEVGGELAKGRPFGVTYFVKTGGWFVWSFRSREGGIDVSEVAKRFGGGGHKAAAGATTSYEIYQEIERESS